MTGYDILNDAVLREKIKAEFQKTIQAAGV